MQNNFHITWFLPEILDWWILQCDWRAGTTCHTQISDATFLWWLSLCKKSNINFIMTSFLWMGFNCLKATEPLRGDSPQEFPIFIWINLRRIKRWVDPGATPMVLHSGPLHWESSTLTTGSSFHISVDSFQRYWWSKNSRIWLVEKCNWQHPS